MEDKKKKIGAAFSWHKVLTVLGITITVMLIPVLMLNVVLIVKGTTDDTRPPSVFGVTPLVVLSGSMDDGSYGAIEIGDLILVKDVDANNLKENEVVAFMEDGYAVTHRIVAVHNEGGKVTYTTRGDANNTDDTIPLEPENVIGQYFYRIPKVGNFILYLQTTTGMLLFVGLPLLLFVIYDTVRRHMFTKSEQAKQEQLKKELEQLKRKPQQANAYKPVQGQVLKQPNNSPAPPKPQAQQEPAQQLNYQKPLPPLPPEVQPMPQNIQQAPKPPVQQPAQPTQTAQVPVPPVPQSPVQHPTPPIPAQVPSAPKPPVQQTAAPITPAPSQAPATPKPQPAQAQAKPVAKKATVQIKKSTKSKK